MAPKAGRSDRSSRVLPKDIFKILSNVPHGLKYSLVYIVNGERVIGYDNAERRGDHRHIRGVETKYVFRSVRQLVRDFQVDVARYKERSHES